MQNFATKVNQEKSSSFKSSLPHPELSRVIRIAICKVLPINGARLTHEVFILAARLLRKPKQHIRIHITDALTKKFTRKYCDGDPLE